MFYHFGRICYQLQILPIIDNTVKRKVKVVFSKSHTFRTNFVFITASLSNLTQLFGTLECFDPPMSEQNKHS